MSDMNPVTDAETADFLWKRVFKVGATAALIILFLFLIGILSIILTTTNNGFTSSFDNWLVVLFKLNTGFSGVQSGLLNVLNPLDIVLMSLFCILSLAIYRAIRHTSKIWSLVALSLPFLGIPIFLITSTAGRSTLLIGGLIFSIIMLRSSIFSKLSAYVGIVASALLFFAGDIATAIFSSSHIIAIFIGVGYVLWLAWFLLIARRLLQIGGCTTEPES